MRQADVKPQERAALITYQLSRGGTITIGEVAEWCEVSTRTIYRDLCSIERVLPLRRGPNGEVFLESEES